MIVWLPRDNPRLAVVAAVPPELFGGPTLDVTRPELMQEAPEGAYGDLGGLPPANQALIAGEPLGGRPIALLVPVDEFFEDRVATARRLWRALRGFKIRPATFTAQRRRRLKLVLRALDGAMAGEGYRGIATGLFGGRVPSDAAWRTHSLRSFTIRLVQDGRALMRGGYLRLLRPDRRDR